MAKETKLHKRNIILLVAVVILILIGIFRNQITALFSIFYGVTVDKTINLAPKEKEFFNIAILGIGGATHEGPDLSDTIILANVNLKQNKVHMFSVPRDLWVEEAQDKVNAVYANAKNEGSGIEAVEDVMQEITGQEIDYVLVLDFEGFTKLVDHLGGIEVNVANTLDDYHYPVEGLEDDLCGKVTEEVDAFVATTSAETDLWEFFPCRYKHLHVDKGMNHMSGQEALEFVRSRHGVGGEGSDFARSRRQQLVISALKDKAFSLGVILNPVKLVGVYNILQENITTNIDIDKVDDFIKLAKKLQNGAVENYVIDQGNNVNKYGLLKNPPISETYRNKWVLIPRVGNNDFSEIKQYVSCVATGSQCVIGQSGILTPTPQVTGVSKASQSR